MNDRIDDYFDDTIARDDLNADERARIDAFDARMGELRERLAARAPADMDTRVMRRIAELGLEPLPAQRSGLVRRWAESLWVVRETQLRWRPAYAFAAAAVLLLALASPWLGGRNMGDVGTAAVRPDAAGASIFVQFRLHAEDASEVALAGSFSDWQPTVELQQTSPGVWSVLLPIRPGVHDYAFVVNGEHWVPDPLAPQVDDGFGGTNSRLALLAPSTP
jgi:hypothetical protein